MDMLTVKEQRLLDYLIVNSDKNGKFNINIGDICTDCKTTPKTLFAKTFPALIDKGYLVED